MLTKEELEQIESVIGLYETRSAAAVEALRIVQDGRGWVSDESLADLSRHLGVSTSTLESLATFYSMVFRMPVGRHVIMVCNSVCCWMQGSEDVTRYLAHRLGLELGGTTPDGRFTLLPVVCIGACDQAPAMLVDWELHGNLTPDKIDEVLARCP
ncbi:MAG: NADH-quinone oxidoreductase subunit NuoE [Actinobacteria bacterium]|nr:NADH-quinone oxidoreductase subunit NuoE [Actinomycetota bacterium]